MLNIELDLNLDLDQDLDLDLGLDLELDNKLSTSLKMKHCQKFFCKMDDLHHNFIPNEENMLETRLY